MKLSVEDISETSLEIVIRNKRLSLLSLFSIKMITN